MLQARPLVPSIVTVSGQHCWKSDPSWKSLPAEPERLFLAKISAIIQFFLCVAPPSVAVGCRMRGVDEPGVDALFCLFGVIQLAVIFWNWNQNISFWNYLRNAGDGLQGAKMSWILWKWFCHLMVWKPGRWWLGWALFVFICLSCGWKPIFRTGEYLNFSALEQIGWVVSEIIRFNSFILNVNWFEATGSR